MKSKNGKEISLGASCFTADGHIGVVTGFKGKQVAVLVLAETADTCHEELIAPSKISIK